MSITKNSTANLIGFIVPLFVTLITVPVYLGIIGAERFGILAVIWAILGYFSFFDLGLGRATAQRMARLKEGPNEDRAILFWTSISLTLLLGIAGGIVLWLSASWLLTMIGNMEASTHAEAASAVIWLIPALPLILTISVMNGTLQGREYFLHLNAINIAANVMIQALPLLVAYSGFIGLDYLVPAALSGRILTGLILLYLCKLLTPLNAKIRFDKALVKPLLTYGGKISVISIIGQLLIITDRLVIAALVGAKAVAYYTVPYSLSTKVMLLSYSIGNALFPKLAKSGTDEATQLANKSTRYLLSIMTPTVIILLPIIDPFMVIWVGKEMADNAAGVGEIILAGVWINALVVPHNTNLQADGVKLGKVILIYMLEIPLYFLMLWVGLMYWGVAGAALAWTFRVAIDTILLLYLSKVLKHSVLNNFLSGLLVGASLVISLIFEQDVYIKYALLLILFALSIMLMWKELSELSRKLVKERYFA